MTDNRAEGAANRFTGRAQQAFGDLTGDAKSQVEGATRQAKGVALDYFGRAVDVVEAQVHRAPTELQEPARKAIQFSRDRPFVTMFGLAAAALVLTSGSRRRR